MVEISSITITSVMDDIYVYDSHTIAQFDDESFQEKNFIILENIMVPIKINQSIKLRNLVEHEKPIQTNTTLIKDDQVFTPKIKYLSFEEGLISLKKEFDEMKKSEKEYEERVYREIDFYFDDEE